MRLRFTVRDLLWLTLVVALGLGWWIDRSRLAPLASEVPALKQRVSDLNRKNDVLIRDSVRLENELGRRGL